MNFPSHGTVPSLFSAGGENSPTGRYINLTQRTDSWVSVPRPVHRIGVCSLLFTPPVYGAHTPEYSHLAAMTDF